MISNKCKEVEVIDYKISKRFNSVALFKKRFWNVNEEVKKCNKENIFYLIQAYKTCEMTQAYSRAENSYGTKLIMKNTVNNSVNIHKNFKKLTSY